MAEKMDVKQIEAERDRIKKAIESMGLSKEGVKKMTLEIGAYGWPFFMLQKEELDPKELYLCVDANPEATYLDQTWEMENNNFLSINADATSMPFLDSASVDEIIMTNVVGQPATRESSLPDLFSELTRVLKQNGKVVITERLTPHRESVKRSFGDIFHVGAMIKNKNGEMRVEAINEDIESIKPYDGNVTEDHGINKAYQLILRKI